MPIGRRLAWAVLFHAGSAFAAHDAQLPVAHDTWVNPAAPDELSGLWDWELESGPGEIFLQFRLPRREWIRSARLVSDYVTSSGHARGEHTLSYVPDDDWPDSYLPTWNQRPERAEPPIATFLASSLDGSRLEIDVTQVVRTELLGDGVLSLAIAGVPATNPRAVFPSRAASTQGFHLALDLEGSARLRPGDVVIASPELGVARVDPDTMLQERLAPLSSLEAPVRIARDPSDGSIVVLDPQNAQGRLQRLDPGTGSLTPIVTQWPDGCGAYGDGLAVHPSGRIYVVASCQSSPDRLLRIDPETGAQDFLGVAWGGLAIDRDGALLNANNGSLDRIDPETGARTAIATGSLLSSAIDVIAGRDSYWVHIWEQTHAIVRIDRATGAQSRLDWPDDEFHQFVEAPDGRLIVATNSSFSNEGSYTLSRYDPADGSVTLLKRELSSAFGGLAEGPLLMSNSFHCGPRLDRLDVETGSAETVAAPIAAGLLSTPQLLLDTDGSLLYASQDRLVRVDPMTGSQQSVVVEGYCGEYEGTEGQSLARDLDGTLLFRQRLPQLTTRILALQPGGETRTVVEIPGLLGSVAAEDAEHLIASETIGSYPNYDTKIWRIDRATGDRTLLTEGGSLQGERALAMEADGSLLVFPASYDTIVRVDRITGAQTAYPSDYLARVGYPLVWNRLGPDYAICWRGLIHVDLAWLFPGGAEDPTLDPCYESLFFSDYSPIQHYGVAVVSPGCSNGVDDDGDGAIDYGADGDCRSARQDREDAAGCGLGVEVVFALGVLASLRARRRGGRPAAGR